MSSQQLKTETVPTEQNMQTAPNEQKKSAVQGSKGKLQNSLSRKNGGVQPNPYGLYKGAGSHSSKSQNPHSKSMGSLYQAQQVHKSTNIKLNVITNRINKLSQEENMLQKKADDIKQRANLIYEIKSREQMKKQEARRKRIEVEEIPFTHPVGQLEMIKCQISKKFIADKNRDEAIALKSQQAETYAQKAKEDLVHRDNLRWKAQQVRQSEKQSKRKQLDFQVKKLESVQVDQVSILDNELKQKSQKEHVLKRLEKIEMDQIKQLNNTKQRNREALDQLDFCKKSLPKDYEEKFGRSPSSKEPVKKINGLPASKFQNQAQHYYLEENKNGETLIKRQQA